MKNETKECLKDLRLELEKVKMRAKVLEDRVSALESKERWETGTRNGGNRTPQDDPADIRDGISALIDSDKALKDIFGVPDPLDLALSLNAYAILADLIPELRHITDGRADITAPLSSSSAHILADLFGKDAEMLRNAVEGGRAKVIIIR